MERLTDLEIAQRCTMSPVADIARKAGIDEEYLEQYGKYKAKIDLGYLKERGKKRGKLILVTAITPTPPERARQRRPSALPMLCVASALIQPLLCASLRLGRCSG